MQGEISRTDALRQAVEEGLDLVEVSPSKDRNNPPVCKIADYGKMMYEQKKKKKTSTHAPSLKEIQVGYQTSEHDLKIKHSKIREFLAKQHRVKYTMRLKGRQRYMLDEVSRVFEQNLQDFQDCAKWGSVQAGGNSLSVTLSPASGQV